MDTYHCPGYVGPWHELSVWSSLYSDYHRSAASPSGSLRCFPSIPTNFTRCGNLSPPPAPQHLGTGLVLLALLLLLPSLFRPTQLHVDSYNPSQWSGTSASIQPVFCESCCICTCILDAFVGRDMFTYVPHMFHSTSTYVSTTLSEVASVVSDSLQPSEP